MEEVGTAPRQSGGHAGAATGGKRRRAGRPSAETACPLRSMSFGKLVSVSPKKSLGCFIPLKRNKTPTFPIMHHHWGGHPPLSKTHPLPPTATRPQHGSPKNDANKNGKKTQINPKKNSTFMFTFCLRGLWKKFGSPGKCVPEGVATNETDAQSRHQTRESLASN